MSENDILLRSGIGETEIICIFRRRRAQRSIRISVRQDGRVLLTGPLRLRGKEAQAFLDEKADWIRAAQTRQAQNRTRKTQATGAADYERKKAAVKKMLLARVKELNIPYGFKYSSISVRNQQSRWGSCSSSGRLSFNYRLFYLPPELVDYVIVHELCHLKEMNHSLRFWALVARSVPDYLGRRRELKVMGRGLF